MEVKRSLLTGCTWDENDFPRRGAIIAPRRSGKSTLAALIANQSDSLFVVMVANDEAEINAMKAMCRAQVIGYDPDYRVPADKRLIADDVIHPDAFLSFRTPPPPQENATQETS